MVGGFTTCGIVWPQLNPVLSKLNVKTAADVDELLDCEVRM